MADTIDNKGYLTTRLEEDRQRMAVLATEVKEEYDLFRRLKASVQKYPWPWMLGAALAGFLLSRLPARRREIYLWSDHLQRTPLWEVNSTPRADRKTPAASQYR